MMGRMIVGYVSLRNVSVPVTISDYSGHTARIGFAAYIGFLALISVSIGVLNLLPIPMLDGGHLMYYIIEAVRGRPIPEKWHENGQRIGLGLLAALMSLAFFNDFSRLFSRSEEHTSELQSLMRISYAVFCLKKKTINKRINIQ